MITDIWGIIPEERTLRKKMEAYPVRLSIPSWILAPPESMSPTIGAPVSMARSMTLHTFWPTTLESVPPITVKSCA